MAFNLQTFKRRTITAIIFAVVMLAGLLINQWTFFILFSIIHFGCWIEYQRLVGLIDNNYKSITPFHKYGIMILGWCIMLYFTPGDYKIPGISLHKIGLWLGLALLFLIPVIELTITKKDPLKLFAHSILGLIYISLSLALLVDMSETLDIHIHDTMLVVAGNIIPVFMIACLWTNDTMAYIIGSLFGKTPLSKISPKKTWEGTMGGVILTMVAAGIFSWTYTLPVLFIFFILILAAVIAIAGVLGDLFQSKLKRLAGVKDSGSIMPGHGGLLDRFDSLLFAVPFTWLYLKLLLLS